MTPADDHDDTWLVYADWLDDHDRPERATLVRHDVETPSMASLWIYEYRYRVVGGGGVGGVVVGVGGVVGDDAAGGGVGGGVVGGGVK